MSNPVIACRNVWKLYGPDPVNFLRELDGQDPGFEALREQGYISAVRDVSLDIRHHGAVRLRQVDTRAVSVASGGHFRR